MQNEICGKRKAKVESKFEKEKEEWSLKDIYFGNSVSDIGQKRWADIRQNL